MSEQERPVVHPGVIRLGEEYVEVVRRLANKAETDEERASILKEGMLAASLALRFPPATQLHHVQYD